MKKLIVVVVALISLPAWADNCDRIKYNDEKYYCKAVFHNSPQQCEFIKFRNTRFYCKAVVNKNPSYCEMIQGSENYKEMCRAIAK